MIARNSESTPELLVLHAVRLLGMSTPEHVAARSGLEPPRVEELLQDNRAYGFVSWSEFGGIGGWSLTERGREENERLLRDELTAAPGARAAVTAVHEDFLPLNARLQRACTDWQIRPRRGEPLAINDHGDTGWDRRIVDELGRLACALEPLVTRLGEILTRFAGYDERFAAAHRAAAAGDRSAVTAIGHDSCHAVWFELHEDLIATLGLQRR